jgi:hypothetical protein
MENINKQFTASELRSEIEHYTELTVIEHQSGKMTKDAEKAWKRIENLIHQLEVAA